MISKKLLILSTVSVSIFLSACSARIDQRGKIIDDANVEKVKIGAHTREDVFRVLGSPTDIESFDKNTWLYIYRRTETVSFFDPKILEEKVLKVTFDREGLVQTIKYLDEKGREIEPVQRETPYIEAERSALEQVFGSFGRIGKDEKKK
ncbi:outer membrane protein assembly factor BamE [Candidatus Nucleicultrix amoebiphila]|uniref:outer membrane protein assembly factor BamE n=1 Tax=Candidatus Nucleicultrix amoebiphila TaxID=1509244 RepID=UPI000A268FB3|nr:outer membrane protein assembly factor BamE [Candidatus Nucleicultrix amoebiphila]